MLGQLLCSNHNYQTLNFLRYPNFFSMVLIIHIYNDNKTVSVILVIETPSPPQKKKIIMIIIIQKQQHWSKG